MKKFLSLLTASLALAFSANAAGLTPDEALGRLTQGGMHRIPAKDIKNATLKYSAVSSDGEASLYVFDRAQDGYIVISADDCVTPLLGYTDSGSFDPNNIPPAMQFWLDSYTKQISYLKSFGLAPLKIGEMPQLPIWDAIEPLVKTKWDQDAPYFNECPEQDGMKCYTGCVATSMAQVMNYFKYPEQGEGLVSYRASILGKNLAMNIGKEPLQWDKMLDTYIAGNYTQEEADAVAYLMKACGYSVQMNYSTSMSGAYSMKIKDALIENFKYDSAISYLDRSSYSYYEWAELLYNNLKNVGPVIYDGTSPLDGGHSFICDGYDGNGYFHFNWGWSGMSDGYFTLDALSPSSLGIGGGSMGGFNFDQDAVFGIQPPKGDTPVVENPVAIQYGSLFGEINGNTLYLGTQDGMTQGWGYMGNGEVALSFGVIVENLDNPEEELQYYANPRYEAIPFTSGQYIKFDGSNFFNLPLKNLTLEKNERYKITFASKDANNSDAEWTPVKTTYGFSNYVLLTKLGMSYNLENIPVAAFTVSDIELLTTLYYGCPVNMKMKIANNSHLQLSQGVTFRLFDEQGNECFTSDNIFLTLNPGDFVEDEQVISFYSMQSQAVNSPTEFTLRALDLETGRYYDMDEVKVTMERNPGSPTIITKLLIDNAEKNSNGIYEIYDNNDIEVTVTMRVGKGYFAYPVTVFIMEPDDNERYLLPIINQTFSEVPFLNGGDNTELNCTINFPNPLPGKSYYMQTRYTTDNSYVWMNNQTEIVFAVSGVDGIESDDENAPVKYYNLQGVEIANPTKGELVIKRQGSKAQKIIVR